jgi:AraC-like DNA-binding protein
MSTKKIKCIFSVLLAALPVVVIISVALSTYADTLFILPSKKYNTIGWWPYSSEQSIVNSFNATSRKIMLEYTLSGSPAYAGFGITLDRNYPFLDLSKYSELTIKLSTARAIHFGVIIMTFEKGITQLADGNYNPLRYNQIRPEITAPSATYMIKLADLKDPEWWISLNAPRGKTMDPNPLKESSMLEFFFDDSELVGLKDRVEVDEVSFHASSGLLWLLIFIGAVCYYIVYGGILLSPRIRRKIEDNRAKLLSSYKRIDDMSSRQKDAGIVRSYIVQNYDNPDISLDKISKEIGMSQKRIADIVRTEYAMNIKECINWLRLQEAKRLLTETDMNITDIAFRLGFNSNSYFGSLFKSREGLSPKEYREKHGSVK